MASSKADTKAAPKEAAPAPWPTFPVRVDNLTARSDKDAYDGAAVKVVGGDHKDALGVFDSVVEYDQSSGYPKSILVRFTDAAYEETAAVVDYGDVVPADYKEPDDAAVKEQADEAEARVVDGSSEAGAIQVAGTIEQLADQVAERLAAKSDA